MGLDYYGVYQLGFRNWSFFSSYFVLNMELELFSYNILKFVYQDSMTSFLLVESKVIF